MERQLAEKIMSNLRERQFEAYYAEDGEQAMEIIFSLVPNGSRIACGGSETLREIGFFEKTADSYTVIQPAAGSGPDEVKKAMRERFSADAFFLSANAIHMTGGYSRRTAHPPESRL
ncbi:MAG: LUD domain-containing protein [Oscillospiraceae bacterium]|nr:LUD domain-containing protein [Oscillospiraceae bacterium]